MYDMEFNIKGIFGGKINIYKRYCSVEVFYSRG